MGSKRLIALPFAKNPTMRMHEKRQRQPMRPQRKSVEVQRSGVSFSLCLLIDSQKVSNYQKDTMETIIKPAIASAIAKVIQFLKTFVLQVS